MDDVADLLSNETIDNMDDFTGKYLTGPPEFRDFFQVASPPTCVDMMLIDACEVFHKLNSLVCSRIFS